MRLQQYDFDMDYIAGSKLIIADALSRVPLTDDTPEISQEEVEMYIHSIETETLREKRMAQFVNETNQDEELQILLGHISRDWPTKPKDVDIKVKPYYHCRDELVYQNGVIMKGTRVVVPNIL